MSEILFAEFFGQKLKEKGLSIKQLSDLTGIASKHLESILHGRFENLPPAPYLHGYFEKLGPVLGFDPAEWWARVRREELVPRSGAKDTLPANRFGRKARRWWLGAAVIVVLFGLYFGLRYSKILGAPKLVIEAPPNSLSRVTEDRVVFRGRLENGDDLFINGEQIFLGENGSFEKEIPLQPGQNTIELTAKKILGREVKVTRQIQYDAPETFLPGI